MDSTIRPPHDGRPQYSTPGLSRRTLDRHLEHQNRRPGSHGRYQLQCPARHRPRCHPAHPRRLPHRAPTSLAHSHPFGFRRERLATRVPQRLRSPTAQPRSYQARAAAALPSHSTTRSSRCCATPRAVQRPTLQ
eukprot:scaffold1302_cov114-Isochrysis_galbana.AAC.2